MITEVSIEPVSLKHARVLERLISDPAVAEPTSNIPHPYPVGGAAAWIRQAQEQRTAGTSYGFSILAGGEFVGSASILNVAEGQGEIGYWVGRPFWGRGYATVAGQQVIAFGFAEVGLSKLIGKCLARNTGSYRVLEKLGFRLTGFMEVTKPRWPTPERVAEFELGRERWGQQS
ncbi:MAG: GNAT family N-acetyltransferase [Verrucomicrobia bacterium]|nr:GNAT family N-acetyltransferase [Verrucomicrobiota bacterium]